jgi:hypothetical protein
MIEVTGIAASAAAWAQTPAGAPRGLRTAVAHAPSLVSGHHAGRRDLLEVTPS